MAMTIGPLTLTDEYSPFATLSFEYFNTSTGEIIGGNKLITITGSVTVPSGANSGSNLMKQLKAIRNIGKNSKCINVDIPGIFSGRAKISNISIDQGPDPTWLNQAPFTIELKAPLESIPPNSLGITVDDQISEISKSESISLEEDSHGYVYLKDNSLSKSFVTFTCEASVTCNPLCGSKNPQDLAMGAIKKIIKTIPDHPLLERYKSWSPYSQSRTLELTATSISFSTTVVLLPPSIKAGAFVDLEFEHTRGYENKEESKKISGTITGLAPISWSDMISLPDTASASKLAEAEKVLAFIVGKYNNLNRWDGIALELVEQPDCPPDSPNNSNSIGRCEDKDSKNSNGNDEDNDGADKRGVQPIKPYMSSVSKSRTDGTISFNFEWNNADSSGGCSDSDNFTRDIVVEITEPQAQIAEHILPSIGTLIQNLECCSAKRISFTSSISSNNQEGICNISSGVPIKDANDKLQEAIDKYLKGSYWLLISHTKQTTLTSIIISKEFIERC